MSWIAYDKGCHSKDNCRAGVTCWPWIIASMLLAAISMLTKEQGITIIGVCALYDAVLVSQIRIQNFIPSVKKVNGL